MRSIEALIEAVREEARRAEFPVDTSVYERAGKDPTEPVLFAGSLGAPVCVFGRDLGKDEVAHGQPLIGAGGKLVRRGLLAASGAAAPKEDRWLESALRFALLTNTVPYKPPGNKAYPDRVKERFRPFVAELLAAHWSGDRILTLGTEAFEWFAPYADDPAAPGALWAREDRYEGDLACTIVAGRARKAVRVGPLPHPSPLNKRWYGQFPTLLARRLDEEIRS
jgi:uracil-DNA glycosylase